MVTGKPFSTLADAEAACNKMFGELQHLTAGFVSVCHFRDPTFARRKRGPAFRPGHGMLNRVQSVVAMRCWGPPAIVMLVAMAALMALTADAAARQARRTTEATAPRKAGEPIMAIVSIKSQQVTFYDADGWILRAPVSTGTTGRETPAGVFAIIEKDKDHHSTLYDDAWMPNMQRITWNGIALHGGQLPGYAASHGCVRMPYDFAEKLFEKTWIGMRVIISPNDAAPVEFSHPALFVPNAQAVAAAPARAETLAREAAEAAKTADEAKKAAAIAASDSASLTASLRKLESLKPRADAELALADKALAAAKTDQARAQAEEAKQKAAANAAEAATQLDAAKADAKSKLDAAAAAKDAAKAAETKKAAATKAASEAKLALEPVSVYISRATQKLYVRRNTHKPWPDGGEVFDATIEVPVTIRNPDRPIGTHVFTAMARNDAGLRWTVVAIDNGDDAKDALDRIIIPQDVLDRIAPTALPRSSIIVSDEPLSRETNYRTEFVAVLNNQPQGGFVTRRPTVNVPVASRSSRGDDRSGFYSQSGNFFFQRNWDAQSGNSFFQRSWNSQSGDTRPRGGSYYQVQPGQNYYQVQPGW
jgi:lipoprotein-anchoring transpeptidase ErfK/SrfK